MRKAEFNGCSMRPVLRRDFPDSLGDTTFTYADYTSVTRVDLDKLKAFLTKVFALFPNGKSASGLTYQEILTTSFYNTASAMVYGTKDIHRSVLERAVCRQRHLGSRSQRRAARDAITRLLPLQVRSAEQQPYAKSLDVVHNPLSLRLLDGANANEVRAPSRETSALPTRRIPLPMIKQPRPGTQASHHHRGREVQRGLYKLTLPGHDRRRRGGQRHLRYHDSCRQGLLPGFQHRSPRTTTVSASSTLT